MALESPRYAVPVKWLGTREEMLEVSHTPNMPVDYDAGRAFLRGNGEGPAATHQKQLWLTA